MHDKPDDQRPEHPDFWNKRFGQALTPWNAAGVPAALQAFAAGETRPLATLIPGCGHAWEAAWLDRLGWPVTALDFSSEAVATARQTLADWGGTLVCADFFTWAPATPPDLIYERAFLCALPRRLWADWGRRQAELLAPGGRLAGFFFFDDAPKGPPFGISRAALEALLSPAFCCEQDTAVDDSLPVFAGRERWQVWRRR